MNESEKVFQAVSDEIKFYRQRHSTIFREAVIVQALITWGITQLQLQSDFYGWALRGVAALACLAVSVIAYIVIVSNRKRVHFHRKTREDMATAMLGKNPSDDNVFYPLDKESVDIQFRSRSISAVYGSTLFILGFLAACVILLAGVGVVST